MFKSTIQFFDKWKQLASMETGRADHWAVVLEELINVIGGSDGQTSLKIVESYDPSTNRWSKVPDMGNAHISAAAVISSGMIFVVGDFVT